MWMRTHGPYERNTATCAYSNRKGQTRKWSLTLTKNSCILRKSILLATFYCSRQFSLSKVVSFFSLYSPPSPPPPTPPPVRKLQMTFIRNESLIDIVLLHFVFFRLLSHISKEEISRTLSVHFPLLLFLCHKYCCYSSY